MVRIKTAIIGFGRMGEKYLQVLRADDAYEVKYICDASAAARQYAEQIAPECEVVADPEMIYADPSVEAVVLAALADSRKGQIERCLAAGKHVIAEKPIAVAVEDEYALAETAAKSPLQTAVNLYLRNAWYHHAMRDFIASGEVGDLAILRICHMTPGLVPGEGHEFEGPSFHDCGMHYVDIARWYAGADYKTWHAQALRMWDYKDPWWLQCHGTFQNGIVFDITQGFVYGHLSKDQTHNSYIDLIGTKGIARMTHDFKTAKVELRGVTRTEFLERGFGGKNLDVLCRKFADSIRSGRRDPSLATFRDAATASGMAWKFLEDARTHDLPAKGDAALLAAIRDRRSKMENGYGLLPKRGSR